MKKLACALIAMIMLVSCCICFAESETPVMDKPETKQLPLARQEDFTARIPEVPSFSITPSDKAFAMQTGDVVAVSGALNIVKTGDNILLIMDVPSGYSCFTQDFEASILAYVACESPDELLRNLVNTNTHMLLWDNFTSAVVSITTVQGDSIAQRIGNLNTLSPDRANEYAKAFAISQDAVLTDVISAGSNTWVRLNDTILVTVVGGQFIVAYWEGETMSQDDLEEVKDLLSHLTCFA